MTFSNEFRAIMDAFEASTDFSIDYDEENESCSLLNEGHNIIVAKENFPGIITLTIILEKIDDNISKKDAFDKYQKIAEKLRFISIYMMASEFIMCSVPILQPRFGLRSLKEILRAESYYKVMKKHMGL